MEQRLTDKIIDCVVVFGSIVVFYYYFFVVSFDSTVYLEDGLLVYPAVVYVAPVVVAFWVIMLVFTKNREIRLKTVIKSSLFFEKAKLKLFDGIEEYKIWKKNRKK